MLPLETPCIREILTNFVKNYKNVKSKNSTIEVRKIIKLITDYINNEPVKAPKLFSNSSYLSVYEKQYELFKKRSYSSKEKNTQIFGKTYLKILFRNIRSECLRSTKKRLREIVEDFFKAFHRYLFQPTESSTNQKNDHKTSSKRKRDITNSNDEEFAPHEKKRKLSKSLLQKGPEGNSKNPISVETPLESRSKNKKKDSLTIRLPIQLPSPPPPSIASSTSNTGAKQVSTIVTPSRSLPGSSGENRNMQQTTGILSPLAQLQQIEEKRKLQNLQSDEKKILNEKMRGLVRFRVIKNDGKLPHLELLCAVKNVYSIMLPNMPKDYTSRLVFDRHHISLIGILNFEVISGITFRHFAEQGFIEIAFVAVHTKIQVSGVGTNMMNHLKDWCQRNGFFRMLTCADNYAVGYFKKQGFSEDVKLPMKRYNGYIKNYDSVTLMECVLRPGIPFLDVRKILEVQKDAIQRKMRKINKSQKVYPGLKCFQQGRKFSSVLDIPGLREAGWKPPKMNKKETKNRLVKVVNYIVQIPPAWPFREPVNPKEVPDYYNVIKHPMDLKTLRNNVNNGNYKKDVKKFHSDMMLVFQNCRDYNGKNSSYYKCANDCEKKYLEFIKRNSINLHYYF